MLRHLFAHALLPSKNLAFPARVVQCRALILSAPPRHQGSMFDVLQILGPMDALFPSENSYIHTRFLRKCIRARDTRNGASVHALMLKSGDLLAEIVAPNTLLNFYGKMGLLEDCLQLFEEMPLRDVVSWCTLISGFARYGFGFEAFAVFKGIVRSGTVPNRFVFSSVLMGCSASAALELGLQVHGQVTKCGTGFDNYVQTGLVDMYAKCGSLDDALRMFHEIPFKNSVSWNVMISGYVLHGFLVEAVELFVDSFRTGTSLDSVTLRVVAFAASARDMYHFCKNLHAYSVKLGLDGDNYLIAELVKLLAKRGDVEYMEKLLKVVKKPEAGLLSLLVSAYNVNNHRAEAVEVAKALLSTGLTLSESVLVSLLNLAICRQEGTQMHARILKAGDEAYTSVSNAVMSMYCSFQMLKDAGIVFSVMPARDIVSWTALISGYVRNFCFRKALKIFSGFLKTGITLDQYCAVTVINACSGLGNVRLGMQIHALTLRLNVNISEHLAASLLHMYSKCGQIDVAANLFSHLPAPHGLVLINIMLAGYCWNLSPDRALKVFEEEYHKGLVPDGFTFSSVLRACSDLRTMDVGGQIHSRITKSGLDCSDNIIGNALINLYIKMGDILGASKFFHLSKCTIPNNSLMLDECSRMAFTLILHTTQKDSGKIGTALVSMLRVCTELDAVALGKILHASIIKLGHASDVCISCSLLEMHEKFGNTCEVAKTFHGLSSTNAKLCTSSTPSETEESLEVVEPIVWEGITHNQLDYLSFSSIYAMTCTLLHRRPHSIRQSF